LRSLLKTSLPTVLDDSLHVRSVVPAGLARIGFFILSGGERAESEAESQSMDGLYGVMGASAACMDFPSNSTKNSRSARMDFVPSVVRGLGRSYMSITTTRQNVFVVYSAMPVIVAWASSMTM